MFSAAPDRLYFRNVVENARSQFSANENRGFLRSGRSTLAFPPSFATSSIPVPWLSSTLDRDCCWRSYPKLHLILTRRGGQKPSSTRLNE